ncbi:GerMN domain-containing protein, partial [Patescibacteria group bacterium]|nr:GerMN domain-containing protein [Patescibacteria group bacterium]
TVVVVVASIGFYLGRLSGFVGLITESPSTNEFHPLPPPPPESEPYVPGAELPEESNKSLLLESPVDNAELSGSFEVAGRVRPDSERLLVSLLDADGDELFSRKVDLPDATEEESYVRFNLSIGDLGYLGDATLRIVYFGAGGGIETRHITLVSSDLVEVNIYLINSDLDPWQTCEKVFPVKRQVTSNSNIYRVAIESLFSGPTKEEKDQGYETVLPTGVRLKSVGADARGVVTADFDRQLERGVAGSCRVGAIRAQIETTLKQFPEVRAVVISIEGEKEGILQP